jgi:hypothetical protein
MCPQEESEMEIGNRRNRLTNKNRNVGVQEEQKTWSKHI